MFSAGPNKGRSSNSSGSGGGESGGGGARWELDGGLHGDDDDDGEGDDDNEEDVPAEWDAETQARVTQMVLDRYARLGRPVNWHQAMSMMGLVSGWASQRL